MAFLSHPLGGAVGQKTPNKRKLNSANPLLLLVLNKCFYFVNDGNVFVFETRTEVAVTL